MDAMIIFIFLVIGLILSWYGGVYYFKKIKKERINKSYPREIIIGLLSGGIVLIVDRTIAIGIDIIREIVSSQNNTLIKGLVAIFYITFMTGVFFLAVAFLFYKGYTTLNFEYKKKRKKYR